VAVYNDSTGLVKGTVPLPGGSSAIYNASGLNYVRHKDWLGSSRLATTWAHAVYSKEAYAPFGETHNEAGTADRSFTGQDQDVVAGAGGTGIYDYLFRKYDPSAGRWLSPDPAGWNAVNGTDPQSLNRYAYVENQPMNATDPSGLMLCISNTVSTDGKLYGYDSGDGNGCAAGFWAYEAPTETVTVNANSDSCSDSNQAACQPTQNAPSNGTPQQPQQPQQNPQPPKKPWFCGTGNSWSHPFTAPTSRQWGMWAASDAIVSSSIAKFTKGTDPFSQAFYWSALLEGYGWAACGD